MAIIKKIRYLIKFCRCMHMLYIIYRCACVCIYIHIYGLKKWAFWLRCAQVAADMRNLKLPFNFSLTCNHPPPGGDGYSFVLPFHLCAGLE